MQTTSTRTLELGPLGRDEGGRAAHELQEARHGKAAADRRLRPRMACSVARVVNCARATSSRARFRSRPRRTTRNCRRTPGVGEDSFARGAASPRRDSRGRMASHRAGARRRAPCTPSRPCSAGPRRPRPGAGRGSDRGRQRLERSFVGPPGARGRLCQRAPSCTARLAPRTSAPAARSARCASPRRSRWARSAATTHITKSRDS